MITSLAEICGLQKCSQIMLTLKNNWVANSQRLFIIWKVDAVY